MNITKISYAALANLGGYENEKLQLDAEIKEGEDWEASLAELKGYVHRHLNSQERYDRLVAEIREKERELANMTEKVRAARDIYDRASTFLTAQGLKTDMPPFPDLPALPSAPSEGELELVDDETPF